MCGKSKGELYHIRTLQAGDTLKSAAKIRGDHIVQLRTGDIDLIAVEAKYHHKCYQMYTSSDHLKRISKETAIDEESCYSKAFSLLLCEIHEALSIEHKVYRVTDIRDRYRHILSQLDVDGKNYKSHKIKNRFIGQYGKMIVFHQPKDVSKSELVYMKRSTGPIVEDLFEVNGSTEADTLHVREISSADVVLYQAALILREKLFEL